MQRIFRGLLFVFLDFNLDIGTVRIELIPDFLGYIFLIQGLSELAGESERFLKARPYAAGMCVYTVILFLKDLLGIPTVLGAMDAVLGLISTVIALYISYNIVMGALDIENNSGRQLDADSLYSRWKLLAVLTVAVYILYLIPVLNIISIIAGLIVSVVFLIAFNRTKNLYYDHISKI